MNGPTRRVHWLPTALVTLATLVLLITALAKILALTGATKRLGTPDPVFGIFSVRQLMAVAAGLEIAVAAVGFSRLPLRIKYGALAWLSSLFLFYRFGGWWLGVREPCQCLGDVWQWLAVSRSALDSALFAVLVMIWVGSCAAFLFKAHTYTNV